MGTPSQACAAFGAHEDLPLLQVPSARVLHCRAVSMVELSLLSLCQHTCSWVVRTWSVERTHLKALHFNRCFLLHHFSDLVYASKQLPLQFLTSSNWLLLPSWIRVHQKQHQDKEMADLQMKEAVNYRIWGCGHKPAQRHQHTQASRAGENSSQHKSPEHRELLTAAGTHCL